MQYAPNIGGTTLKVYDRYVALKEDNYHTDAYNQGQRAAFAEVFHHLTGTRPGTIDTMTREDVFDFVEACNGH